jgi:regulator of sirC expression with transglutaminase-like and TPR domain
LACLDKVDDWGQLVDQFTRHIFHNFLHAPERFRDSEAQFRVIALTECLQRHVGLAYNYSFSEGEYDASDSRNLFIHGLLQGFGGTCVTMPVLCCAIGRRLGYPLTLAETREHFFCRWDDDTGEHFCFDATSRGCAIHDEDYYRHWPKPITPKSERDNGFIRSMTCREELAAFAESRGNCLFDKFRFTSAVEAFYLAHKMAPDKHSLYDAWGLAVYSSRIWQRLESFPDAMLDSSVERVIQSVALELSHPDIECFRSSAVDNLLRIIRKRRQCQRLDRHDAAFQNFPIQQL